MRFSKAFIIKTLETISVLTVKALPTGCFQSVLLVMSLCEEVGVALTVPCSADPQELQSLNFLDNRAVQGSVQCEWCGLYQLHAQLRCCPGSGSEFKFSNLQ